MIRIHANKDSGGFWLPAAGLRLLVTGFPFLVVAASPKLMIGDQQPGNEFRFYPSSRIFLPPENIRDKIEKNAWQDKLHIVKPFVKRWWKKCEETKEFF
jgi:hypothetical protein